jgi:hypothetical protein
MPIKQFNLLFLFVVTFLSLSAKTEEKMLHKWVMDRQQWQPTTRSFIKKYSEDSDAQILARYLKLFTENSLANKQPKDSLITAAEQTVEFFPGGIAELEYILTGQYPEGPRILIAVTESKWIEHLSEIERRIQKKIRQEK